MDSGSCVITVAHSVLRRVKIDLRALTPEEGSRVSVMIKFCLHVDLLFLPFNWIIIQNDLILNKKKFVGHMQTMQTQTRRPTTCCRIRVSTVCLQNAISKFE